MAGLLSDTYNEKRRKLIGDTASLELRPGSPGNRAPHLPSVNTDIKVGAGVGEPTRVERETLDTYRDGGASNLAASRAARGPAEGDTCHLDVIDRHGNMVAITPSGGWLQSNPVVPGLGFCMGTRAQMYWLEEGVASSLAPGRRPRTTLTPSMALKDGKACLAFGSPGGDNQDQWIAQFFLRHIDHKLNLQAAIDGTDDAVRPLAELVLSARRQAREDHPRGALPQDDHRRAQEARPRGRGLGRLVAGPQLRRPQGRQAARAAATARHQQAYAVGKLLNCFMFRG